jgi:putative peptide zinc metalloprotease protein
MVAAASFQGLDQRLVIQTANGQSTYLLVGERGRYIKISASAYYLLRNVQAGRSFEHIADQLSRQRGTPVAAAEVEVAYQRVVDQITTIENKTPQHPPGFWIRTRLLSASTVQRISRSFTWVFHPVIAPVILVAMVAMFVLALSTLGPTTLLSLEEEEVSPFFSIYGLFLLSLVFHELGHASACTRYGVRPKDIGFAFYWIYPVLYTDVNAAWQLTRWQRVVVDLAGVFFQLIVGSIYLFLAWFYTWEIPLKAFVMVFYGSLFMLNPFLRFDGYWVVADALGIANFGQQFRNILHTMYLRLRGRPTSPLPWSTPILALIAVYGLGAVAFWGYFLWWVVPELINIVSAYPVNIGSALSEMLQGTVTAERLESLFLPTFAVVGMALIVSKLTRTVYGALGAVRQRRAVAAA